MVNFFTKLMNFRRSYVKWAKAGKPLREKQYVFELYDNFCSQCPDDAFILKKEGHGECDECGCSIKRVDPAVDRFNALAWPTKGCPNGHFKADIDTNGEERPTTN
jgi:hypothetical protein